MFRFCKCYYFFLIGVFSSVVGVSTEKNLGDIDKTVDTSLVAGSILMEVIKAINIIFRRARIQQIRNTLDSEMFTHIRVENKELMNKYMTAITIISKIFISFGLSCAILWAAFPIIDKSYQERRLPLRAWFPWDTSVWFTYSILYTYQVISILIIALVNTSQDALMCSIVILCCCQLDMLNSNLMCLGQSPQHAEDAEQVDLRLVPIDLAAETKKSRDLKEQLKKCIFHQKEIIRCIKEYEKILTGPIFGQFIVSCITICVVAFQLSVTKFSVEFISQFVYMCTMLAELFLYCYPGHEIMVKFVYKEWKEVRCKSKTKCLHENIDGEVDEKEIRPRRTVYENILDAKSQLIATAVYRCPWYDQDMEFKKMMITLMERAKRPITLTAGQILPLKLETLTSILQSSYSYYIVLQRMHSND